MCGGARSASRWPPTARCSSATTDRTRSGAWATAGNSGSMIQVDRRRAPRDLLPKIARVFAASAAKIRSIERTWRPEDGAPVFTVDGVYRARGWTDWPQGCQFGAAALQSAATDDRDSLQRGRAPPTARMPPHL